MFTLEEVLEGPITVPFKARNKETQEERDINITYASVLQDNTWVHIIASSNLDEYKYVYGELGNKCVRGHSRDQWRMINTEFTHLADGVIRITLGHRWRIAGSPQVN